MPVRVIGDWGIGSAAGGGSTLNTGIVAFWKLDNVNDAVGSNTLTNTGSVSFANAGIIGNCATFSGTNYLRISDNTALSHNSSISIAGWFYLANVTTGFESLVMKYSGGQNEWKIEKSGNALLFVVGSSSDALASLASISVNTWHSFIAVFDAVAQTTQLWIDNSITAGSVSYTAGLTDGTSGVGIGAYDDGGNPMTGRIDAVGIWKKAFTSAEQIEFHNAGAGKEYPF